MIVIYILTVNNNSDFLMHNLIIKNISFVEECALQNHLGKEI